MSEVLLCPIIAGSMQGRKAVCFRDTEEMVSGASNMLLPYSKAKCSLFTWSIGPNSSYRLAKYDAYSCLSASRMNYSPETEGIPVKIFCLA